MFHYYSDFIQALSQASDWINPIHLPPSLESPNIASLYLHSSPTNFYNKLNKYLRSHNYALNAAHLHHFNNTYL